MKQGGWANPAKGLCVAAFLSGLDFAAAATTTPAQSSPPPPPLVLQAQGSFYVGGSTPFRSPNSSTPNDPKFVAGNIAVDQMYVEYQIPEQQKYKYPIVMMHGGGHTGVVFETTPDGREGWYTSFARRGFAVYVVDGPNRGRSGYDPTSRFAVIQGLKPPADMQPGNMYSAQSAWTAFRWGPDYGVPYPNEQFPLDHVDDYLKELVPSYRENRENDVIATDLDILVDKIGPCILLGWSTGAGNVMMAATHGKGQVKAVVTLEGVPPDATRSPVDLNDMAKIPMLVLIGDHTPPDDAQAYTAKLAQLGDSAETIFLPDRGLYGNGHTMMMERDNEKIADLIEDWVQHHAN